MESANVEGWQGYGCAPSPCGAAVSMTSKQERVAGGKGGSLKTSVETAPPSLLDQTLLDGRSSSLLWLRPQENSPLRALPLRGIGVRYCGAKHQKAVSPPFPRS